MSRNQKKSTANHKKEDGTFHSKHVNHNPQAESARAVFGLKSDNSKEKEKHKGDIS
ncbi:CPC_1213 family protein [Lacrimispora sp.]|uniref:CPC_1213 family protein n=1 Tax=Lacrimispora sp. TaxID=2719234 RepID=UPI003995E10D